MHLWWLDVHQDIGQIQLIAQQVRHLVSDPVGFLQRQVTSYLHMEVYVASFGVTAGSDFVDGDDARYPESCTLDFRCRKDRGVRQE